ncbi:MAG: hypothetical protein ACOCYW_02725 [Roseicyclus sp.]
MRNRDTAWCAAIYADRSRQAMAVEAWPAPESFDAEAEDIAA